AWERTAWKLRFAGRLLPRASCSAGSSSDEAELRGRAFPSRAWERELGGCSEPQLLELARVDRRRGVGHHVAGPLVLRERDHVADVLRASQPHREAIQTQGDAAVRRGTRLQRIEQEPEALSRLFFAHAQHPEHMRLHLWIVDSDAAAADLVAVHH